MTLARPFGAVRYDASRVELSNVIVPPYDVIAADERESFYERDPHNAIRFELTRKVADEATTDYAEVGETLVAWLRSGVLLRDERPAYYVMRQRFVAPSGETLERIGFFAELGLEDYSAGVVLPHERTLAGPTADRRTGRRARWSTYLQGEGGGCDHEEGDGGGEEGDSDLLWNTTPARLL